MKKWIALVLVLVLMSLCACTPKQTKTDFEIAEECIDKSVEELYELIGEPLEKDYAPSCLGEGGEDGNLYYDGFIVYTYKEGEKETVHFVEKSE